MGVVIGVCVCAGNETVYTCMYVCLGFYVYHSCGLRMAHAEPRRAEREGRWKLGGDPG